MTSCSSSRKASVNKDVTDDIFAYGRIKIYQKYDDIKMKEISSQCRLVENKSINKGGFSIEGENRVDYFFDRGLFVFQPKFGRNFNINNL